MLGSHHLILLYEGLERDLDMQAAAGGLEHVLFSIIYGMSSFPLTFIFSQRGSNHQPAAGSDELNLRSDTSGAKLPNLAELRVRVPGTLAQCHGTKAQVAPGDAMVTPEVDVVWPRVVITAKNGPTTG